MGRATAWLESTGIAVKLAGAVAQHAVLIDRLTGIAVDPLALAQSLAFRADIAVVVEGEGRTLKAIVAADGMIDHGYVRFDAALLDQP